MSGVPIVDLSPIGDQDGVSSHSSGLAAVGGVVEDGEGELREALNSWENGPTSSLPGSAGR